MCSGLEKAKTQSARMQLPVFSSRLTNEEYYLFGKLFRKAIGTDQIVHGGNGSYKGLTEGLSRTLGIPASTNSIQELRKADCILIIGVDPGETHPIVKNEIHLAIRKNRAQLIVLGSYDIGLTRETQFSPLSPPAILLLQKPGMEVSLLNAMIQTILKEGLENKDFIEEKTEGIEALKKIDFETSPGSLSEATKRGLEKGGQSLCPGQEGDDPDWNRPGRTSSPREVAIAASNLALITGHLGKESSGILILQEKCNSQGAIDKGIFPGRRVTRRGSLRERDGRKGKGPLRGRRGSSRCIFPSDRSEKGPGGISSFLWYRTSS